MNSNHYQLFTILIGFRTASPEYRHIVKMPLIFKSDKKRLFLYRISTLKGQSVPQ